MRLSDYFRLKLNDESEGKVFMAIKMAKGSLFAVLLRSPWWYSALIGFIVVSVCLFITDAHYIHNSDLSDMTFSERYRVLCQHLPLSDNNATSGLIEARELPPQLWGATSRYGFIKGLMARKKIDLGSFCSFGEKHTPSVIIGEKSPDYCDCVKAGNKIATLRDHASKRSHTMKYPVEKTKMMLKSVRVIGGINETELSLIF